MRIRAIHMYVREVGVNGCVRVCACSRVLCVRMCICLSLSVGVLERGRM